MLHRDQTFLIRTSFEIEKCRLHAPKQVDRVVVQPDEGQAKRAAVVDRCAPEMLEFAEFSFGRFWLDGSQHLLSSSSLQTLVACFDLSRAGGADAPSL